MQTGIVTSLHTTDGNIEGFFVRASNGEETSFRLDEGREFLRHSSQPFFDAHRRLPPPKLGDLLVYERYRDPRARLWGYYSHLREIYANTYESFLPLWARMEFPYLTDVLLAGRRLFTPGEFRVKSSHLRRSLFKSVPKDDLIGFILCYYFVADLRPDHTWHVQELDATLYYRDIRTKRDCIHPAPPINVQLSSRGITLRRQETILVKLEVDDRFGLIRPGKAMPQDVGVQHRTLTVYI